MRVTQDLQYALRMLRHNPGFAVVAGLTMALGIGANTAIFSLVNAVLLQPLPYPQPQQLVSVKDDLVGLHLTDVGMSQPELQDYAERSGIFEAISATWPISGNLTGSDRPERVEAMAVSPGYFHLLGTRAQLGRVIGPEDRVPGFAEAAVLSDGLWQRLFGGDPHILGKQIRLDTDLYTVVGVMPPAFRHPGRTLLGNVEVWIAADFAAAPFPVPPRRNFRMIPGAIGRLKPGISVEQAQLKLEAFDSGLASAFPNDYPPAARWTPRLTPLQEDLTGNLRTTLWLVFGAVLCVLLICCVSIANLTVAKAIGRQREISVRRALGAPTAGLVWQLLTESLLISLLGGALGWLVVRLATPLLPLMVPVALPVSQIGVNGNVLWFAIEISMLAGIVFGLAPVIPMLRTDIVNSLKEGVRGSTSGAHNRLRSVLVGCEIAFSLMLMVGAGLLLHSFWNLNRVDPGFNPRNVLVAGLWLPVPNDPTQFKYGKPQVRDKLVRDILAEMRSLPGVEYAAMGNGTSIPLLGGNAAPFYPEGFNRSAAEQPIGQIASVSADFFRVLQARLVRGRVFTEADNTANLVAVVDESTVQRIWPNQDPVGKRIGAGPVGGPLATVVGVVGNLKTTGFEAPDAPHIYFSIYQRSNPAMSIMLRTGQTPAALAEAVRRAVRKIDPDLPVFGIRSMEEVVSKSLAERRFQLQMIGAFAVVALLLAAIGIYGVTAFWVSQRTQEIGIRMALGAGGVDVVRMVVRQGMSLTIWGVAAGLAGAVPVTRLLRTLLFGTTPFDPLTFAGIAVLLGAAALLACYLPARRATRVDPLVALRTE